MCDLDQWVNFFYLHLTDLKFKNSESFEYRHIARKYVSGKFGLTSELKNYVLERMHDEYQMKTEHQRIFFKLLIFLKLAKKFVFVMLLTSFHFICSTPIILAIIILTIIEV